MSRSIGAVATRAERSENFVRHHFRETENGIERRSEFVAHMGGKFGPLGAIDRRGGSRPFDEFRKARRLSRFLYRGARVRARSFARRSLTASSRLGVSGTQSRVAASPAPARNSRLANDSSPRCGTATAMIVRNAAINKRRLRCGSARPIAASCANRRSWRAAPGAAKTA